MFRLLFSPLRLIVRSALLRFFLIVGILLAMLGMVASVPAWAAARIPCDSALTWSLSASLVAPDDAQAAIAAAYEQVAPVARLDVMSGQGGTVRFLWLDRGTGSTESPGTSTGTSIIGSVSYTQHAYLPGGAEGDALKAQVLKDILGDLGVSSPTSGATLSAEDRATLETICAAPVAAPASSPDASAPAAPADASPETAAPAADDPADNTPSDDAASGPPLPRTAGLALAAVAVAGVTIYFALPMLARFAGRLRRKPAAAASTP